MRSYEAWIGRTVDYIPGFTGSAGWKDYVGSPGYIAGVFGPLALPIHWSVPLMADGGQLSAAAKGDYDNYWKSVATTIANVRPRDQVVYIRVGWEFNGDWQPWFARGKEADYIAAFDRFVTVFRHVSDRFKFDWCPNIGLNKSSEMNPELAYPGDEYVDVIGIDFYWDTKWTHHDPVAAWESMVSRKYGLQWHQDFAAAHGKPTAVDEWGINSDGPEYISSAAQWFKDHHMLWQNYWDNNSDFKGSLQDGSKPNAAAAYKKAFGP